MSKRFPSDNNPRPGRGSTFTITFDKPWSEGSESFDLKRDRPLVCATCGSLNWVCAIREDSQEVVDICHDCNSITKIVPITKELFEKYHRCIIHPDLFESLWRK